MRKVVELRQLPVVNPVFQGALILSLVIGLNFLITQHQFRLLFMGSTLMILLIPCLNVQRGTMAVMVILPFIGLIRRVLFAIDPSILAGPAYVDPTTLIIDIATIFMFLNIVVFNSDILHRLIAESRAVKVATILMLIFAVQIFNPLQGNILVGLAGAKFYIVPMLWFFIGLFVDDRTISRLFHLVLAAGCICSLYGLYQMFVGFLPFEESWISASQMASLGVGGLIRSFSSFASPEEYAKYLQIAGTIAVAYLLHSKGNPLWSLLVGVIGFAIFMSGVRSAIFGLLFAIVIFVATSGSSARKILNNWLLVIALSLIFPLFVKGVFASPPVPTSPVEVYTTHSLRGVLHPYEETTFISRLKGWRYIFTDIVPRNPFGYGLGSTTIATNKFGGTSFGTESYWLGLFVNSGVAGGITFSLLIYLIFKRSFIAYARGGQPHLLRAGIAVLAGLMLTNIFGSNFSLYSIAPMGWLLMGWMAEKGAVRSRL